MLSLKRYAYCGHHASIYENVNVEVYRNNIGKLMGIKDVTNNTKVDYVCAISESGISYAIGYANVTKLDFLRPLIKYTDIWNKSFTAVTDEE